MSTPDPSADEARELQSILNSWIEAGVIKSGEIYLDADWEGWQVRVNIGWSREWTADEFLVYTQGLTDAARVFRRGGNTE